MSRKSQKRKSRTGSIAANRQVPNRQIAEAVRQELSVVRQEIRHFSGPVPSPEDLEKYEKVCPGYAQELLDMAKKNLAHNQEMEIKESDIQKQFLVRHQELFGRGQIIGGSLAILAIICGTIVAVQVSAQYGAAIIGSVMLILTSAFAWGKWVEGKTGMNPNGKE